MCGWSLSSGARPMSDYLRQTGCAKSSRSLTLYRTWLEPSQPGTSNRAWVARSEREKEKQVPPPMDPKTRQHDIVKVGWVIDAVPPGKRAARKHQVINGGGTCSSKKPETTLHVEQRRARAAIKPFGPCSLVSSIDSAEFTWSQRVLLGFMILGRRTCGSWRDCSGEALRRLRGRTTGHLAGDRAHRAAGSWFRTRDARG